MDCHSSNLLSIWSDLAKLTQNCVTEIKKCLEEQTLKLDVVYNDCLSVAQKDPMLYVPNVKTSKRQSKFKNSQSDDTYSSDPSFQQPAVPPVRKTRKQTSIAASDKTKNLRESATISSGPSTRASRARALSTLMDITQIDCPRANSTFAEIKKFSNNDELLSPQLFSPEEKNKTYLKKVNPNETYKLTDSDDIKQSIIIKKDNDCNMSKKSNKSSKQAEFNSINSTSENKHKLSKNENKREKVDNTDSKEEESSLHMTRTKKRKLEEEKQNNSNIIRVPLEKQVSNFLKPTDVIFKNKGNEAEKRKEMYLKSKADQTKFDELHLKVIKQREEQIKRAEEKMKKIAEEKKRKEDKQKEKELKMKEEALKKQKQTEIRLAEINAKRKRAEEAKLMKLQKSEADRLLKLKDNEMKKIENSNTPQAKIMSSNLSSTTTTTNSKPDVILVKSKINQIKKLAASDDYGLNDISARDSSEDESGPKKPVPDWAKRSNRKITLELQYIVDTKIRDSFFDCPKQFSLKEMFQGWNIRDRQRTSSAVWNTPVRYSEYLRRH
ncbi:inner centromere protein-like [Daktulosphaira vitifoliae]|uniref:inner centromere protein-like n=1 Tax=Daktulosphaira vitifoliae TaxID=58002 RepID=UPI0021A9C9F6|nr:inner centromere protein-like [Daktulosphaira vitifoliae]